VRELLLCTHDPIFIKNLYVVLREEGYEVDVVEHTSLAVQRVFQKDYTAVIFDSESIGLPAADAAEIINAAARDVTVIIAGNSRPSVHATTVGKPVDIEEVRQLVRKVCEQETKERSEGGL
jgi:DNA-binding NtrC family response regulator